MSNSTNSASPPPDPDIDVDVALGFLGSGLDGIFYGFHAAAFGLFLVAHRYRKTKFYHGFPNIVTVALFILCTVYVIGDFWDKFDTLEPWRSLAQEVRLNMLNSCLYSIVDFLAQIILLYRCWILWERRLIVVFFPAILSLASLGTGLALFGIQVRQRVMEVYVSDLGENFSVAIFSFAASLAVNSIVMALIIIKIWSISQQIATLTKCKSKDYHFIIAILLESGLSIFILQSVWLTMLLLKSSGFFLMQGFVTQIYGITPTLIIIRVAFGASYDAHTMASELPHIEFASRSTDSTSVSAYNQKHITFTEGNRKGSMVVDISP